MSLGEKKNNTKVLLLHVVDAILYRLKQDISGENYRVNSFLEYNISGIVFISNFVVGLKMLVGKTLKKNSFAKYKNRLDMSCIQLEGYYTPVRRGSESFGYQGRKKCKTTNMLFVYDNQGIPLECSQPIAENHHDTFELEQLIGEILKDIKNSNIKTDGLFLNTDTGFDTDKFRDYCFSNDVFSHIDLNSRNGKVS